MELRLLIFLHFVRLALNSCPFQTPFWFKTLPKLMPVFFDNGEKDPSKAWLEFGPIQNRKCVDYFRIETSKIDKFGLVKDLGPHIGRNELGGVVDLVPCTQYKFKVAAYEFFHGTGKIFPVWSKEVTFVLDYTPKFIVPPIVYEKVASPMSKVRRGWYAEHGEERKKRGIYPFTTTTPAPTTEPFLTITVVWEIAFIDYPICLDRVEFQYLNIEWDESVFTQMYNETTGREGFVVHNKQLPCDDEFAFMVKVYGVSGKYSNTSWNPPSCVSTTPVPTTPPPTPPDFQRCHAGVSFVFYYLYCSDY